MLSMAIRNLYWARVLVLSRESSWFLPPLARNAIFPRVPTSSFPFQRRHYVTSGGRERSASVGGVVEKEKKDGKTARDSFSPSWMHDDDNEYPMRKNKNVDKKPEPPENTFLPSWMNACNHEKNDDDKPPPPLENFPSSSTTNTNNEVESGASSKGRHPRHESYIGNA